jgi:hypothetical protein
MRHRKISVRKYSDLLRLEQDRGGNIPMDTLRAAFGFAMPDDVLEQFCCDHASKDDFQQQYGHLDLRRLSWELREISAGELVQSTVFEGFKSWVSTVSARLQDFDNEGWSCIDLRPAVVEHWKAHRTWIRPPILLDGHLVGRGPGLHLVEGHTRLGVLAGAVKSGLVSADSIHRAWIGEC